eukprot:114954-Amphidinium_carterae.1
MRSVAWTCWGTRGELVSSLLWAPAGGFPGVLASVASWRAICVVRLLDVRVALLSAVVELGLASQLPCLGFPLLRVSRVSNSLSSVLNEIRGMDRTCWKERALVQCSDLVSTGGLRRYWRKDDDRDTWLRRKSG